MQEQKILSGCIEIFQARNDSSVEQDGGKGSDPEYI